MTDPSHSGPSVRPQVKICGITDAADASRSIELGAELIGLNFYAPSPRYIAPDAAAELVAEQRRRAKAEVLWVGVFVNEPVARAVEIGERVGLDLLQFHGDETPEQIAPVAGRSIKALRVRGDLTADLLDPWRDLGLWGLLIDARHDTLYGGSGERWNVDSLPTALGVGPAPLSRAPLSRAPLSRAPLSRAPLSRAPLSRAPVSPALRLLVAGGLDPSNAADVARAARPWGLDLCSGVESSPGRKDPDALERLFSALDAFDALNTPPQVAPAGADRATDGPKEQEKEHGQTTTAA
ncbi:MAG: phosphoribosylanthranilate isomerase [Acidobacteriota bacterium]